MRRLLLGILVLGLAGTGTELLLLHHYDNAWQIVPLALIVLALVVLGWHGLSRSASSIYGIQAIMTAFIFSGMIGMGLHQNANAEFELEMDPSLSGMRLFRESLSGATPALAPGTMIQLGLIGLLYAYRHPGSAGFNESRRQEWNA
jgi:hypothetical protein